MLEKMSKPREEAVWPLGREVAHGAKAGEQWAEKLSGFVSPDDTRAAALGNCSSGRGTTLIFKRKKKVSRLIGNIR